ncbi:MAG: hypothetical protein [Wendovervirus sonii]|uniref:Uncharacterized protein n=1 Tax=phage Lak_Megaphage_Sonny TaxID=3109229 RepID=A0ABZ0Z252_9CAUD|nr:MAG: hypothetical protein [phage Lak_Megaphage_Sonny]
MAKEIVFVIDCDEVIRPLIQNMVDFYNHEFGTSMTYNDVTSINKEYKMFPLIKEDPCEWFFQKNGKDVYQMRPPIEGSVEALRILRKYGKVIIASNQPTNINKIWTLEWFEKYGIEYDNIFFGRGKKFINCDFLIDDDPQYFIGAVAKHGIFIDSIHNRNENLQILKSQSECKTINRFKSLKQFADYFEKYYNR